MKNEKLKSAIDSYKDFPKKGIVFRDVLPILLNPDIFSNLIKEMSNKCTKFFDKNKGGVQLILNNLNDL